MTNIGDASEFELTGVTEAMTVPDWPGVRLADAGATEMVKSGAEPACALRTEMTEAEG